MLNIKFEVRANAYKTLKDNHPPHPIPLSGKNPLYPIHRYCRNPQFITSFIDLHIIQQTLTYKTIQVDKSKEKNPSRQALAENANSMTIKILGKIKVALNN